MKRCEARARVVVPGKVWHLFTAVGAKKLGEIHKDEEGIHYYKLVGWTRISRQGYKTRKRAIEMALERV